uniref:Uncharacterized protein LOC100186042 n=1 Tax=Phallusia mammillata TaxID=59560 RepID=A0A6F9DIW9_9ASCI|nr:uncharacterized protein LOC100186042 [Phallusia mammillata]
MVCLPDEGNQSLLDEAEKRTRDKQVIVDDKTSYLIRKSGKKDRRNNGTKKSQSARQERVLARTKQPPRPKTARPERSKTLGPSILRSTNMFESQRTAQKPTQQNVNVIALHGSDRKITKTVRFETTKSEPRGRKKATNNPRPNSASAPKPASTVPRMRQAWGAQDSKNITLLRKAEKSLHRVELLETKRQLETESNVLWEKLKLGMTGKLKESIESGDRADLWQALCEFRRYFGDGDLSKDEKLLLNTAQEMLRKRTADQYVDNLKTALKQRNVETLEHLLYQIDNETEDHLPKSDDNSFRDDVERGRALVKQLGDLQKYRSAILAMSRQVVSEIHSFQSPPDVVKASVLATFLLLGENERKINDWTALHALLGKLGRLSVTRRVALCDPSSVPLSTARRVIFVLKDVTYERIHKINKGACTFYCWANCMAQEVLVRKGDEDTRTVAKPTPKEKLLPKRIDIEFWSRLARPRDIRTAEQNFREKMSSRNRMNRAKSAVTVKAHV